MQRKMAVYLSLGSNMGDTVNNLDEAIRRMQDTAGVSVVSVSPRYKTRPIGKTDQDWFLNQAVHISTTLDPYELLTACQHIENELGRVREERWGPRTIDIDIIHYEGVQNSDPQLTLPHPRFHERAFVLVPLADIVPNAFILDKSVAQYVRELPKTERHGVIPYTV